MAESKREDLISRGSSASGGRGGRLWAGLFFAVPAGPGCQESDLTPVPDTGFASLLRRRPCKLIAAGGADAGEMGLPDLR